MAFTVFLLGPVERGSNTGIEAQRQQPTETQHVCWFRRNYSWPQHGEHRCALLG
jgi:hypothetical protein